MEKSLHIIAEAGTNHNADLSVAKKLVDVAKNSKADSIKFQIIYPEGLYLPQFYCEGDYKDNEVFYIRQKGRLSDDEYLEIANYCRERNIAVSASIFDQRGIDLLVKIDAPYIKIASCDLNNSSLLVKAAETGRKVIISTGMASLQEIEQAIENVIATGNIDLVLMHCVSIYPAPLEKMNLGFIDTLKTNFGFPVGLSDHTESSLAGAVAVSKGVQWIEKHFTLDRSAKGFDHAYAMEPDNFKIYIEDIRAIAQACSVEGEKLTAIEAEVKTRARRGLYAARDISPGESLGEADILIVRPEAQFRPNDINEVLGRNAVCPIYKFQPLDWKFLK